MSSGPPLLKLTGGMQRETPVPDTKSLPTLVIGISGSPCSGKTSLAIILRQVIKEALRSTRGVDAERKLILQSDYLPQGGSWARYSPEVDTSADNMDGYAKIVKIDRLWDIDFPRLRDRMTRSEAQLRRLVDLGEGYDLDTTAARDCLRAVQYPTGASAKSRDANNDHPSRTVFRRAVSILRDAIVEEFRRAGVSKVTSPHKRTAADRGRVSLTAWYKRTIPIVDCKITVIEGSFLFAVDRGDVPHSLEERQLLRDLSKIRRDIDIALYLPLRKDEMFRQRLEKPDYYINNIGEVDWVYRNLEDGFWATKCFIEANCAWQPRYHTHIKEKLDSEEREPLRQKNKDNKQQHPDSSGRRRNIQCYADDSQSLVLNLRPMHAREIDDTLFWAVEVLAREIPSVLLSWESELPQRKRQRTQ